MREQFGVLALGQCGSNIAIHLESLGYTTVYVNSSKEDLDTIKGAHKIHIAGGDGAAKDRQRVLKLASESIGDIVDKITTILTQKFIIVPYATSGGTGSGLSTPLLRYLTQIGRVCIPVPVLPDISESAKACENAYNACVELMSIQGLGATFLLDNSREDKYLLNKRFAKELDTFITIKNNSVCGIFDPAERKQMLLCPGVSVLTMSSKSKSTVQDVVQGFHNGIYPEITSKSALYLGISTSNKSLKVSSLISEFNGIYDTYLGISEATTVAMLSGLQWPLQRIEHFKNKFEQVVNNINTNNFVQEPLSLKPLQGLSFTQPIAQQTTPTNPRDILMNLLQN